MDHPLQFLPDLPGRLNAAAGNKVENGKLSSPECLPLSGASDLAG